MVQDCVFCKILAGELPADFVFRNGRIAVFKDIRPHAPVHLLVVPEKHIRSVNDIRPEDGNLLAEMLFVAKETAKTAGVAESGYKLLFNVERGGGQVIFHLHLHILGGFQGI
jgi:histidine triad (HIT) family protein